MRRRHLPLLGLLLTLCLLAEPLARSAQREQSPVPQIRVGIARPDGGYAIVTLPIETYVARVLAGEAARNSRPAALEALAVTIRTYAFANRTRHRADGFDLCDQTHCQVLRPATAATERAASATASQVLLQDGQPAVVYYSASCGGHTESPSQVWPGADDPPHLRGHVDDACEGMPAWSADVRADDLVKALRAAGFRGDRLRGVRVSARTSSGRVGRLALEGLTPSGISGQDLRVAIGRTLGWQWIKSAAFDVQPRGDVYRFTGRGSGHGVGLCVIGATNLAVRGKTAADILAQYFPGLRLASLEPRITGTRPPPPAVAAPGVIGLPTRRDDVTVTLPEGDEGEREVLGALVTRVRDEMARVLNVPAPPRVALIVHATMDEYVRRSDTPWFTPGALVNGTVHLPPVAVLRERGVLEASVRRHVVHLLVDGPLARRPAWVREGAASYFAERGTGDPASRAVAPGRDQPCPDDAELLGPVSAGALSNAYARARACFARQFEAGRDWKDVR